MSEFGGARRKHISMPLGHRVAASLARRWGHEREVHVGEGGSDREADRSAEGWIDVAMQGQFNYAAVARRPFPS